MVRQAIIRTQGEVGSLHLSYKQGFLVQFQVGVPWSKDQSDKKLFIDLPPYGRMGTHSILLGIKILPPSGDAG